MFSGSLVAIVTPMLEDGAIDLEAWDRLLDLHLQAGTSGVVVGGSTGESVTLTEADQDALLAHARRAARRPHGVDRRRRRQQHRARRRARARAGRRGGRCAAGRHARLQPPDAGGAVPAFRGDRRGRGAPVVLYNVPGRTAVDLLPATVARLAELPRIVGIKEAVGEAARVRELLGTVPAGFRRAVGR